MESISASTVPTKKRYEWIDNGRFIALFLIVFFHIAPMPDGEHPTYTLFIRMLYMGPFLARVSYFFFFAGFFLARNATWRKTFSRAALLLLPLVIWNSLVCYGINGHAFSIPCFFSHILGINGFFNSHIISILGSTHPNVPDIGPSWFLRDLLFFTLLTPLFVKFRVMIIPLLILMAAITPLCYPPDAQALMAPGNVFSYLLGVACSKYDVSKAYVFFNRKNTLLYIFFVVGMSLLLVGASLCHNKDIAELLRLPRFVSGTGIVFSIIVIGYSGILIEKHLPKFSKMMASCGPACFLVFILHVPLTNLLKQYVPHDLWYSWGGTICVPTGIFFSIVAFYFLIKRFAPLLLPILTNSPYIRKDKSAFISLAKR